MYLGYMTMNICEELDDIYRSRWLTMNQHLLATIKYFITSCFHYHYTIYYVRVEGYTFLEQPLYKCLEWNRPSKMLLYLHQGLHFA
jgi:hypothetical protein